MERLNTVTAYGATGERHTFEAYAKTTGAPYIVMLDGAFLATCESGAEIGEEIEDTIRWFNWQRTCPIFA